MSASRQGMSSEEMEQVVAQQVANAIEAIAIYKSKICMAHDLMNRVIREEAMRIEVVRAHAAGAGNKKAYAKNLPYCNKCKLHHTGPCTVKCGNCKRVGHMKKNCRTFIPAKIKRAPVANQKATVTCFGCGAQGHFKSKCPRLEN
ncbi:reverse transcriptase domain-containing protein [Tanacetum coccineum]